MLYTYFKVTSTTLILEIMKKLNFLTSYIQIRIWLFFGFAFLANFTNAQPLIGFTEVATGLNSPIQLVNAGDGTNRMFIAEKGGAVKVFQKASGAENLNALGTFLTLTGIATTGEQGLLSLAFHPGYKSNGLFFVYYTNAQGDLELARYRVSSTNANLADPSSKIVVLTIPHPNQANHNGGEMHFGSDGNLYLSIGDGGGGNDPSNNAQNTTRLLGKMLRITVSTANTGPLYTNPSNNPYPVTGTVKNEIFATGLRNPFRWSFDRTTGDMWIGDVGQSAWEEINHRTAATALGANYGWGCYEGNSPRNSAYCIPGAQYHFPIHQYATGSAAGSSVVGGVVYRGTRYPGMQGYYIGADFYSGNIHIIGPASGTTTTTVQNSSFTNISDFGEAENGEVYALGLSSGAVYVLSDQTPLPVKLTSFTGTPGYEGVGLNWQTAMEKNFSRFDVEYSTDAQRFFQIGTVNSNSTLAGNTYQFFHQINDSGDKYYRLKMIDQDNSFNYSNIISINGSQEDLKANFVRPSLIDNKMMHVLLDEPFNSLELVSTNGNILFKQDITHKNGTLSIPVEAVSSGMYIVRLQGNDRIVNQKILIVQ
jgi:glucose/arabinose dehydrogenase